jgi:hypothetical protein
MSHTDERSAASLALRCLGLVGLLSLALALPLLWLAWEADIAREHVVGSVRH